MFSFCSHGVEPLGEAHSYGWRLAARCAAGKQDGMKHQRLSDINAKLGRCGFPRHCPFTVFISHLLLVNLIGHSNAALAAPSDNEFSCRERGAYLLHAVFVATKLSENRSAAGEFAACPDTRTSSAGAGFRI